MGLPELTFTLKKAAETVSTRISRGAVALILRDAKANGVHVVCQESDIPTTLGADNIAYIKRTLMGYINRPSAVYVSVVPAAGTIAAGFSALAAYTYDYIAGPSDISAEDATALAALVKERRKLRYIGKAVLPNTAADYEGVINFVSAGIAAGGKTAFSAAAYCSRIAGMLAGTPAQCSATYAQLSEVTGVTATENPDAAVDAGKLFIIDDGRVRKLSRAVTSKVTIGDTEPEALKKIKMTAAIDLIRYYAVSSVEDDYFGKCANPTMTSVSCCWRCRTTSRVWRTPRCWRAVRPARCSTPTRRASISSPPPATMPPRQSASKSSATMRSSRRTPAARCF